MSLPAQTAAAPVETPSIGTLEQGVDRLEGLARSTVAALPTAGVGLAFLLEFIVAGRLAQLAVRSPSPVPRAALPNLRSGGAPPAGANPCEKA